MVGRFVNNELEGIWKGVDDVKLLYRHLFVGTGENHEKSEIG
jgi:hypothetical protein